MTMQRTVCDRLRPPPPPSTSPRPQGGPQAVAAVGSAHLAGLEASEVDRLVSELQHGLKDVSDLYNDFAQPLKVQERERDRGTEGRRSATVRPAMFCGTWFRLYPLVAPRWTSPLPPSKPSSAPPFLDTQMWDVCLQLVDFAGSTVDPALVRQLWDHLLIQVRTVWTV